MIFAEMQYPNDYSDIHAELVNFIKSNFSHVQSGLQGDSWIWITEENDKVAIDTFSSMKHQVKCEKNNITLINKVINTLSNRYKIIYFIRSYKQDILSVIARNQQIAEYFVQITAIFSLKGH